MITPRPYQSEAVTSVYNWWQEGKGNPIVVAPTGAGKSIIIALLIDSAIKMFPETKILVLADQKELIEQDCNALKRFNASLDVGINSASVGIREVKQITFAQIQSVHRKPDLFGFVDFVIVDEAHMVNTKQQGMYRKFLDCLKMYNEKLKVVGFTATPYRLGAGYVWTKKQDALFDGMCYDISIRTLINEGFLVTPIGYAGKKEIDRSKLELSSTGDYKEESCYREFSKITEDAVVDMQERLADKKTILVFACGIAHAEEVVNCLKEKGEENVGIITGSTPKAEREELIGQIKSGAMRWCINVGVLTKGFDAPNIDAVVLLRATESAALYVQMVGRGLRPCEGKKECIVLDYGGNVKRHGAIDDVKPRGKGERIATIQMAKECPNCKALVSIAARDCIYCGYGFPVKEREAKHEREAEEVSLLSDGRKKKEILREVECTGMKLFKHIPKNGIPCVRVQYYYDCFFHVDEFICPYHHNEWVRDNAMIWLKQRGLEMMGVEKLIEIQDTIPVPKKIVYISNNPYKKIKKVIFDETEI